MEKIDANHGGDVDRPAPHLHRAADGEAVTPDPQPTHKGELRGGQRIEDGEVYPQPTRSWDELKARWTTLHRDAGSYAVVSVSEAEAKVEEAKNESQAWAIVEHLEAKVEEKEKARRIQRDRVYEAREEKYKARGESARYQKALECILSELVVDHDPDEAARIAHAALYSKVTHNES